MNVAKNAHKFFLPTSILAHYL